MAQEALERLQLAPCFSPSLHSLFLFILPFTSFSLSLPFLSPPPALPQPLPLRAPSSLSHFLPFLPPFLPSSPSSLLPLPPSLLTSDSFCQPVSACFSHAALCECTLTRTRAHVHELRHTRRPAYIFKTHTQASPNTHNSNTHARTHTTHTHTHTHTQERTATCATRTSPRACKS